MRRFGCHRTIYRTLFVQTRGALKKELIEHLRLHHPIRRSRHATAKADTRGEIPDMVSIRERPASVEDRAVPGHWEGDLLSGTKNSYIITLVERQTRYVMLGKIPRRDTQTVINALIKLAKKLPDHLYQSLTWDRGKELTDHRRFTMATDIQVYFCDPQSPWQRGSNENTNRLLRQYFPKGTDLSVHSQARLNYVARELNERPRETLGFKTPKEKFQACVASTTCGRARRRSVRSSDHGRSPSRTTTLRVKRLELNTCVNAGIGTGTAYWVAPTPTPPSQLFGGTVQTLRVPEHSAAQNM